MHALTWMDLKCITLSEKSQFQNVTYCYDCILLHPWNDKTIKMEKRLMGIKGQGPGQEMSVTIKGLHKAVLLCWQNSSVSWLWWWLHKPKYGSQGIELHTRTHSCTHKWVYVKTGEIWNKIHTLVISSVPMYIIYLAVTLYCNYIRCHHWETGWRAQGL